MARAAAFDQTVPIENRVDGALGRNPNITIKAPNQELADLARAPMWLLSLELDQSGSRSEPVTGWHSVSGVWSGHSAPQARAPCNGQRSCSRSCAKCRTPGTHPSSPARPGDERQSDDALPSANSLSTASTPPAEQKRKV